MEARMIAAVFHGVSEGAKVEERPVPEISKPSDVLLEVKACGVCGTDPAIMEGRHPAAPPVILGHEYSGVVREVGSSVTNVAPGDHVVIDPNLKCHKCFFCRQGQENMCENMTAIGVYIDGAFAKYNLAPESAVYKIPDDMAWSDAALVEPVACVLNGVARAGIKPGKTVAIIGAGPIGLIWTALAKRSGAAKVIVSEMKEKRIRAAEAMGADITIDPQEYDPTKRVKDLTGERGADISVEVVGHPTTVRQAIEMVRHGGRTVLFGTTPAEAQVAIAPYEIMRYEKEIVGSYISNFTFPAAIQTMYKKMIPSEVLFSHSYKVSEFNTAIQTHRSGESIKILMTP